jgi:SAM-dependent methyltransferase
MKRRAAVVPLARGDDFELGCGGGINHRSMIPRRSYFNLLSYAGIDPHPGLHEAARAAARSNGWAADLWQGRDEAISFASSIFDCLVCTFILARSKSQCRRLMREWRRIPHPDGQLLFLDHGCALRAVVRGGGAEADRAYVEEACGKLPLHPPDCQRPCRRGLCGRDVGPRLFSPRRHVFRGG